MLTDLLRVRSTGKPPVAGLTRSLLLAVCFLVGSLEVPAFAQDGSEADEPPPPWELSARDEGEPRWAPLLRIRAREADYRDTQWWNTYKQMLAQEEAAAGNHTAALSLWDSGYAPRDSVGVLPEGIGAVDAIEYLSAVADTARVIMINERHHAGSDRLLMLALLPVLREKGYRYFAAETFSHTDSTLNLRGYPTEDSGIYIREPVFAEVVREALRLGYLLVPYESTREQSNAEDELTPQQRRDFAQAKNLHEGIFAEDPDAKVLIHAGYSHILEEASERWHPMALYFRELTGIDPTTIDQTRLGERSQPGYEHPAYRAAVAAGLLNSTAVVLVDSKNQPFLPAEFAVDIQVLTPRTTYTQGRPDWMSLGGRRKGVEVLIPECKDRRCFVEVRDSSDPPEAIPLDWAEEYRTDKTRLFLPPDGDYVIHVFSEAGESLRTELVQMD